MTTHRQGVPRGTSVGTAALPDAVIFDIDGTLAIRSGRGPYDWGLVGTDKPNRPIVELAKVIHATGLQLLFVSGRPDSTRHETANWLDRHIGTSSPLFMRIDGDPRSDVDIKRDIYRSYIEHRFKVSLVFDDRNRIVSLWRNELGLTCLQVAEGDF